MKLLYFFTFILSSALFVSSLPVEGDNQHTAAEKDDTISPGEANKDATPSANPNNGFGDYYCPRRGCRAN